MTKIIQFNRVSNGPTKTNDERMTKRTSKPNPMMRVAILCSTPEDFIQTTQRIVNNTFQGWEKQGVQHMRVERHNDKVRLFNNVGSRILLVPQYGSY